MKESLKYFNEENRKNKQDLSLCAYLMNPLKDTYYYDDIARDYLDMTIKSQKETFGKASLKVAKEESAKDFLIYVCYEGYVAYRAYETICSELENQGMFDLFINIEIPLVYTLFDMEKWGIKTDKVALAEYSEKLGTRIAELENEFTSW